MYWELISRRKLLCSVAALLPFSIKQAAGQAAPVDRPERLPNASRASLVKEIKNARLLDVSADSSKLCLYSSRHPVRSFTWSGTWKENKAPVRSGEEALRIVNANSWIEAFARRLPALPYEASFFADGGSVYVEIPGVNAGTDHILIELLTGNMQQRSFPVRNGLLFSYWALGDHMLLGAGRSASLNRVEVLVKAEAPDYNEVARVPFAEGRQRPGSGSEAPISVAADRRTFVYAYDSCLVCRRGQTLETLWTHTYDPELPFWRVGISADGSVVAAAAADTVAAGYSTKHYVGIFSGRDGRELTRLPILGLEGVAISPDGKTLAVGERVPLHGRKSGTQPTVTLFDIASRRKLATIIHDQFYGGGGEFLYAGVETSFSPDGSFLITSGLNTKIWRMASV